MIRVIFELCSFKNVIIYCLQINKKCSKKDKSYGIVNFISQVINDLV